MRKLVSILKYSFLLIIISLLAISRPNQAQPLHSVLFTGEVFASQSDDGKVYNLDIKRLEKVQDQVNEEGNDIKGFTADILKFNGKKVRLTGYLLLPYDAYLSDGSFGDFALGKNAYGCPCCSWGSSPPPTIFNVVLITMKDGEKLKPPFTPLVEVTGTFYARQEYFTDEKGKKKLSGLFFIQDAEARKKRSLF